MDFLLCALGGAAVAALLTWLVLRPQVATLRERLAAREASGADLEQRLAEQTWLVTSGAGELTETRRELARLEAQQVEERKAAQEKLAVLNEAQARLSDAFKALSSEALKSNNEAFLNLAKVTLEKFQEGARGDLEKRQAAIDQLVKPVQEMLTKFDAKIGEIEKARVEAYGGLTQQVRGLLDSQQSLQQATSNLAKALGAPQTRGRWGGAVSTRMS